MKLSTGKVAFPIEFDNGDKQNIYFNPNDPDLVVRIKNVENRISKETSQLEDIELSNDGTPTKTSQIEFFEKIQNIIKKELDYAFGGNVSDIVFKHCSPFAIVNGDYFISQFIKAIRPEIENEIKKARAEVKKNIQKHIGKYQ